MSTVAKHFLFPPFFLSFLSLLSFSSVGTLPLPHHTHRTPAYSYAMSPAPMLLTSPLGLSAKVRTTILVILALVNFALTAFTFVKAAYNCYPNQLKAEREWLKGVAEDDIPSLCRTEQVVFWHEVCEEIWKGNPGTTSSRASAFAEFPAQVDK